MTEYIIKKNLGGTLLAVLIFILSWYASDTPDDVMMTFVCVFMFVWIMRLIFSGAGGGNGRKAIIMVCGLFGLLKLIWYVVSLKPIRRWLFRLYYVGPSPRPYPYLPLFGSLLDTHVMMYKLSAAFYRDKTPAARAALWRLLARGVILLGQDQRGQAALLLNEWTDSPSDGLDQELEKALFCFLKQSKPLYGAIDPSSVEAVMTHCNDTRRDSFQYHFADLLNTGISLKAYLQRDVRNIFGMKRFLSNLTGNYGKYVVPELADAQSTGTQIPEISLVWKEYMTFAYLFGIEGRVWRQLTSMLPPGLDSPLFQQLKISQPHRKALKRLMNRVSAATPAVEDAVAGKMGLLPIAWHANEIYDI